MAIGSCFGQCLGSRPSSKKRSGSGLYPPFVPGSVPSDDAEPNPPASTLISDPGIPLSDIPVPLTKKSPFEPFKQLKPSDITYKLRKGPKTVRQYAMGSIIGEGSYASVREAIDTNTLARVAIKIIKRRRLKRIPGGEAAVLREVSFMRKLGLHQHIVHIKDYFKYEEKTGDLFLVMEFMDAGTLMSLIEHSPTKCLSPIQIQDVMRQVVDGVEYIHRHNVVHRDLKPDNLLLSREGVVKISDFGSAQEADDIQAEYDTSSAKITGSPAFTPPELASGVTETYCPAKVDMWGLGVTLYIMAAGRMPFSGNTLYALFEDITQGNLDMPSHLDPQLAALIRGLLHPEHNQRLSLEQVRAHPWMNRDLFSTLTLTTPTAITPTHTGTGNSSNPPGVTSVSATSSASSTTLSALTSSILAAASNQITLSESASLTSFRTFDHDEDTDSSYTDDSQYSQQGMPGRPPPGTDEDMYSSDGSVHHAFGRSESVNSLPSTDNVPAPDPGSTVSPELKQLDTLPPQLHDVQKGGPRRGSSNRLMQHAKHHVRNLQAKISFNSDMGYASSDLPNDDALPIPHPPASDQTDQHRSRSQKDGKCTIM
eukprot:TRINITY_DN1994_c0_g1_i2.p1 TRINITY_DN1994_c0_g1~~TRINITY_DN1994_c0_g1_i2.p1  ORF type:complete len:595 (+),score=91.52 TRINITY_DN1994_c0_g1_i2:173-1957(+)